MKTPLDIQNELEELTAYTLPKLNEELDKLGDEYTTKNHKYQLAYSKEITPLRVKFGKATVRELEAMMSEEVQMQELEVKLLKMRMDSTERNIKTVNTRIDVLRSSLSFQKGELSRL